MKRKVTALALTAALTITAMPFGAAALGNTEALRENYSIYNLNLDALDNYILLHFYTTEVYKVFTNPDLCKNSQIQAMYKSLRASLTGDEEPEEVFPIFEKLIYELVIGRGLSAEQLEVFIATVPEALQAYGVDAGAIANAKDKEALLKAVADDTYTSLEDLAKTLRTAFIDAVPAEKEESTKGFADLEGAAWAEEAISYLTEQGILNGRNETEFAPHENMKREEVAKLLALAFELSAAQAPADFGDVAQNSWYAVYVNAVTESGYMNGYGEGFGVGDYITREDLAVICYRALQKAEKLPEAASEAPQFADEKSISSYAQDAVSALTGMGVISGMEDGSFAPQGLATRAQAAKIVWETLKMARGVAE